MELPAVERKARVPRVDNVWNFSAEGGGELKKPEVGRYQLAIVVISQLLKSTIIDFKIYLFCFAVIKIRTSCYPHDSFFSTLFTVFIAL